MTTFIDIEDFIAVWDLIDDDTILFLPIMATSQERTRSLFFETFTNQDNEPHLVSRAFLTLEEAQAYLKQRGDAKMSLAKIRIDRLYKSFENCFGKKKYSKTFECVLSSVNDKNEFQELDILWTNKLNG
jgi:hypothetical protein